MFKAICSRCADPWVFTGIWLCTEVWVCVLLVKLWYAGIFGGCLRALEIIWLYRWPLSFADVTLCMNCVHLPMVRAGWCWLQNSHNVLTIILWYWYLPWVLTLQGMTHPLIVQSYASLCQAFNKFWLNYSVKLTSFVLHYGKMWYGVEMWLLEY